MRDITLEDTIYILFTTRSFATGIPTVLAGTPVISIYEENNLVQITTGVSISVDYDSVVGLNQTTIVATSANGYENGKSYSLVITTGTVDSVSVVGEVVGEFTIRSSAAAVDLANVTDGLGALKTIVDAIPTTPMRGTDGALTDKTDFSLSTAGILAIWHQLNSAIVTAGSMGKLLKDEITSVRMSTLTDWVNGGRLDLLVDAIKAVTDLLPDAGALTTISTDTARMTAARAQVLDDWINAGRLDVLLDAIPTTAMRGTDGANTTVPDAAGTVPTAIEVRQEIDTNSTKTGYVLSTTGILAIWHQLNSAIVTAGSVGKLLVDEITSARMAILTDWIDAGRLDTILDELTTQGDTNETQIGVVNTDLSNATDGLTALKASIDAIPTTAMRGTDSAALASVATEARLSELDAVTTGKMANQVDIIEVDTTSLNDTKIPDIVSLINIQGEVDTALSSYDSPTRTESTSDKDEIMARVGFAGVGLTHLAIASINTEVRLSELDSVNIPSDIDSVIVGTITNAQGVDVATDVSNMIDVNNRVDVGSWLGTSVTTGSGAPDVNIASTDDIDLTTTQKASVNTEVDTALTTTTYGEPGQGAPAVTASIKDKLSYMYKFMRNKITNDGINVRVYDNAGTTIDQLSPVSSVGGTVTRGEFITGA